jgi:osmotically-inducible protein OsmY
MKCPTGLSSALIAGVLALAACEKSNPQPQAGNPNPNVPVPSRAPDNTAQNKPDRNRDTTTPIEQGESKEAVRITADIRKALMDEKGLSTNAHNCKIMTDDSGVVTLRGVVDSQAEKDTIEEKAKAVAGVSRVVNQLEVKGG